MLLPADMAYAGVIDIVLPAA